MTWAAQQLATSAGELVTLRRGAQSTASVTAVWQRPQVAALEAEGLGVDYESREWVVAKAAYVFGGTAREPQAGDRIVDADGTWQVLPEGDGAAWHSDGGDWVITTKLVNSG
jgi:hypothetical protein